MKHGLKKLSLRSSALLLGAALALPGLTAHAATTHTAKDSDTFWKLSTQYKVPLQKLMNANPSVDPLNIYNGLKLVIPSSTVNSGSASKAPAAADSTKPVQMQSTSSGESLAYSKIIDIKASAYSAAAEENGGWGAVDYFGNPLKLGTIAVDPKVIAFGTRVYIEGYDFNGLPQGGMYARALDAGGAIKGKRIDIFVPGSRSLVSSFGFQNVKVYILE